MKVLFLNNLQSSSLCSFIMAADYWQDRFHGKNVAMDMTMIYIIVAFATVLLNNIFLTLVPYRVRIATGERMQSECIESHNYLSSLSLSLHSQDTRSPLPH